MGFNIQIGIVGMGGMGRLYVNCFRDIDGCNVCACVSSKKQEESINNYSTIDDMLDNEKLDVVCICTPSFLHYEQALRVMDRGVNVICEKPLAFTSGQIRNLYDKAFEKKVLLMGAHVVRYADSSRILYDAVHLGTYGEVKEVFMSRLSTRPWWSTDMWTYDVKRSGHVPYDLHLHDLDLMLWVFGEPLSYEATPSGTSELPFAEHWWFRYKYPGFEVTSEAAWYDAQIEFNASWRVNFERALIVNDNGRVTIYEHGKEPVTTDADCRTSDSGLNMPISPMYMTELRALTDAVKGCSGGRETEVREEEAVELVGILEKVLNEFAAKFL